MQRRPSKDELGHLSPLEADVLKILWRKDNAMVRDIYNIVRPKRKTALTSIAVTLDRLHDRKLVARSIKKARGGYCYIYSARTSKNGFERSVIEKTVNRLINNFGSAAVTYFNERFSKKRVKR